MRSLKSVKCLLCGKDFTSLIENTGATICEIQNIHIVAHFRRAVEKVLKLLNGIDDIKDRPEVKELEEVMKTPYFSVEFEDDMLP